MIVDMYIYIYIHPFISHIHYISHSIHLYPIFINIYYIPLHHYWLYLELHRMVSPPSPAFVCHCSWGAPPIAQPDARNAPRCRRGSESVLRSPGPAGNVFNWWDDLDCLGKPIFLPNWNREKCWFWKAMETHIGAMWKPAPLPPLWALAQTQPGQGIWHLQGFSFPSSCCLPRSMA